MKRCGYFITVIYHLLDCLGSWIACCLCSGLETAKGAHLGPDNSDDSWSSSTHGMDSHPMHLSRNSSLVDIKDQRPRQSSCNGNDHSNFINQGLIIWNQGRRQWLRNKESHSQKQGETKHSLLSWTTSYGTFSGLSKPLQQRAQVPLSEMVDCLVDIWDQEGLYD